MNGTQKAVYGAIVGALIAFLTVVLAGLNTGAGELTAAVWVAAAIAALAELAGVGGTVYATTNKGGADTSETPPYPEGP